jgi:hypothetical protein
VIDLVSCVVKPSARNIAVIANGFLSLRNKPLNSQVTGTQTHAILQSVVQGIEVRAFGRGIDTSVTAKKPFWFCCCLQAQRRPSLPMRLAALTSNAIPRIHVRPSGARPTAGSSFRRKSVTAPAGKLFLHRVRRCREAAPTHKIWLNHQVAIKGIAAVQSESLSAKGRTDVTPCRDCFMRRASIFGSDT